MYPHGIDEELFPYKQEGLVSCEWRLREISVYLVLGIIIDGSTLCTEVSEYWGESVIVKRSLPMEEISTAVQEINTIL